jgi:hypothetical protein
LVHWATRMTLVEAYVEKIVKKGNKRIINLQCVSRDQLDKGSHRILPRHMSVDPRDRLKVMTRTLERICSWQKHGVNMQLWMFNFMVSKIASQVSSSSQRKLVRVTHVISKVLLLVPHIYSDSRNLGHQSMSFRPTFENLWQNIKVQLWI